MPVQLRFKTGLPAPITLPEKAGAWQGWRAARCTRGGAAASPATAPTRAVSPPGTRIARWYCPQGIAHSACCRIIWRHAFPGRLSEIEQVVATAEQATQRGGGRRRTAPRRRSRCPARVRWVRRRRGSGAQAAHDRGGICCRSGCKAVRRRSPLSRARLACDEALVWLRELAQRSPASAGASARIRTTRYFGGGERRAGFQQRHGARPAAPASASVAPPIFTVETRNHDR